MAKKSKRSRNGSPKSKKSRPSLGPDAQLSAGAVSSGASSTATAIAARDSALDLQDSAPDSAREPESQRRARASSGILPPSHESSAETYADEISIPPVTSHAFGSDMSADDARDLEDSFFVRRAGLDAASNAKHAAGHAGHDAHDDHDHAAVDPRTAQKMSAAAHARRQHLSRYVKWTVGVSAALLLLGVGRVAFRGKPEIGPPPPIVHSAFAATADTTPHSIAARDPNAPALPPGQLQAPEESQAAADQAVAALDNPNAPTKQDNAPANPAAVQTPPAQVASDPAPQPAAAAQPAAPVAAAAAPVAPAATPAVAPSDKTAAQEKAASSKALERGNAKGAIEAGERSVALDATDGEAWLVLGAAYQQIGKNADAHRCFNACIKEGKKGPISECRAMLQ